MDHVCVVVDVLDLPGKPLVISPRVHLPRPGRLQFWDRRIAVPSKLTAFLAPSTRRPEARRSAGFFPRSLVRSRAQIDPDRRRQVMLYQVMLYVSDRHAAGVERDDHADKAVQSALALADEHRGERAVAVARDVQLDVTGLGRDRLRAVPVARLRMRRRVGVSGTPSRAPEATSWSTASAWARRRSSRVTG